MSLVHSDQEASIPTAQDDTMTALLKRLWAAEVGSRELDAAVCGAVFTEPGTYVMRPVTTSLDAALALAGRVLPEWGFYLRSDKDGHGAGLSYPDYNRVTPGHVEHKSSLPLALCAAILRAKDSSP